MKNKNKLYRLIAAISAAALILTIALCAASCGGKDIKSVTIDDKIYYSGCLGSFKDADISAECVAMGTSTQIPTEEGFAYVEHRDGDSVRVWRDFFFKTTNKLNLTSEDLGTNATLDKVIKDYSIKVEEKKDTYIITYYTFSTETFFEKSEALDNPPEKQVIEVVKERVSISYFE